MKLSIAILAFCVATSTMAGQLHRWVDENGVTHFSDRPPSKGKSRSSATVKDLKPTGPSKEERAAKRKAVTEALAAERKAKAAKKAESQKKSEQKAAECKDAKRQYAFWQDGGRIYKTKKNGETHYYSAKEIDAKTAHWKKQVSKSC